jgi:hypothetical protein
LQPIRQLDRAWNDKDLAALDQLWADDYLFIGWTGEIMDKHQRLAAIRSGKFQVQSVESDEVKVWVFNDVAFVTDRERIRMKQGEITVRRSYSSLQFGRQSSQLAINRYR